LFRKERLMLNSCLYSMLKNEGYSSPATLTLLVSRKLAEGGPPSADGPGSGNYPRHTSNNPIFNKLIDRDWALHLPPVKEAQKPLETLEGWQKISAEDSEDTRKNKSFSNAKIFAEDLHNRLSKELGTNPKNLNIIQTKTSEEFQRLFGQGNIIGIVAFCNRNRTPISTVFKADTSMEIGQIEGTLSEDQQRAISVIVHENIHAIPPQAVSEADFLASKGDTYVSATPNTKETFPRAYSVPLETRQALLKLQDENGNPLYTEEQVNRLSYRTRPTEEAIIKEIEKVGINLAHIDSSKLGQHSRIDLDKEEAITEVLARHYTKELIGNTSSKFLTEGNYPLETVALLANMLDKHQGDRDSALSDLKTARMGGKKENQDFANSLKFGIEVFNNKQAYTHLMETAHKHGIIDSKELQNYRERSNLPESVLSSYMNTLNKSGLKPHEVAEMVNKKKYSPQRSLRTEEAILKWFYNIKED